MKIFWENEKKVQEKFRFLVCAFKITVGFITHQLVLLINKVSYHHKKVVSK